jgi:CDP-glucose 4,6-dehydratase
MNAEAWKDKRVLVTGHTGFKGTWLCATLLRLGARVGGYALAPDPETQTLYPSSELDSELNSFIGDLSDMPSLQSCFTEFRPQFVFHLAAQSLVRASYGDPLTTFQTNVMGTANLLECCRSSEELQGVVVVTSDKCYENQNWLFPYRETDRLGGHDPYSASKACTELVVSSFRDSFLAEAGILVASARAGNVIGGGDFATDRLVPDAIRAFRDRETLEIRSPEATRPWQHVLDPLSGYLRLAAELMAGNQRAVGAFNFGPSGEATVRTVVEKIIEHWADGAHYSSPELQGQPHEASRLHVASDKAKALLGWEPRWELDEAVERTAMFYRRWAEGQSARTLLNDDIARYFKQVSASAP